MKHLIIAIDCDDVLIHTTEYRVAKYNSLYGTTVELEHAHSSKNPDWKTDRDEVFRRLHAIQLSDEYALIEPPKQTVGTVKKLAAQHELHLVTARNSSVLAATERMLDSHYPGCFISVHHIGADASKGDICKEINADVMIDDNLMHLESAFESGVEHLIWFGDYPWQRTQVPESVTPNRCRDWQEVQDYIDHAARL